MAPLPPADGLYDLEQDFAQVAVALFAKGSVETTLQHIVELATQTIDGCEGAGVMVIDEGRVTTVAASNALVDAIDRLQIETGEGPCLDSTTNTSAVYAQDLSVETRWRSFAVPAVEAGVRCVLAYSLTTDRPAALNLYARFPAAFGATDRAKGQLFATLARLALDSAELRAAGERSAFNLSEALLTRELIGQAQGILMERELISAEQAFDVLRRASQHMNVKLREVAASLVETGESPDTGGTEQT